MISITVVSSAQAQGCHEVWLYSRANSPLAVRYALNPTSPMNCMKNKVRQVPIMRVE